METYGSDPRRVADLRDLLDRFERASDHFRESRRQALLGVREAILVIEELAAAYGDDVPILRSLSGALLLGRGAVDLMVSRMAPLEGTAQQAEIRLEAMGILKDLLVAELMRIEGDDAESQARKDAMLTVIGVIDQEMERLAAAVAAGVDDLASEPAEEQPPPGVEWIKVET